MKLIKLKDDLYIPEDFENFHHYFADEEGKKRYTGITTVLGIKAKPSLIPWASRMNTEYIKANAEVINSVEVDGVDRKIYYVTETTLEEARVAHTKKMESAGEHGTNQHMLVEAYIKGCIQQNEGKPLNAYMTEIAKFAVWAVENVDHFLYSERPVHSSNPKLFLAGTIDFGAVMKDGSRRVCDLKTGSGIYYEAILQTEFYQILAEEEGDEKYDGSVIVRLGKKGDFDVQFRSRNEIDTQAALGALALYRGDKTYTKAK